MKRAGLLSAVVYTSLAAGAALLFLAGTFAGPYTAVERVGGAGWVFFLSLIVLMPVVTQRMQRRHGGGADAGQR